MTTDLIIITLEVLIALLGAYLIYYARQKGTNQANREDLKELTGVVEDVKQKFIERTETLKARLDLLSHLQLGHKNEERNTIIRFHESLYNWINMCIDSGHGGIDDYSNELIDQRLFALDSAYHQVLNAEAMLGLFVENTELSTAIHNLKVAMLENLTVLPKKCLINIKTNNSKLKALESITNYIERGKKHSELMDERLKVHKDFNSEILEGYKKVIDKIHSYESLSRKHIKKITED